MSFDKMLAMMEINDGKKKMVDVNKYIHNIPCKNTIYRQILPCFFTSFFCCFKFSLFIFDQFTSIKCGHTGDHSQSQHCSLKRLSGTKSISQAKAAVMNNSTITGQWRTSISTGRTRKATKQLTWGT